MRTKTLVCAAALIAAGVATSMAQSNVFSLNIVGYANVPAPSGFTFQSNPLDVGTNGANEVIPNSGQWDFSEIHQWTGVNYQVAVFDSSTDDTTTGFIDRNGNPIPVPILNSGKGYLLNRSGASNVVTYVGQVRTGTNVLTYPASALVYAVGSPIPYSGGVSTALGFTNSAGNLDFCEVQQAIVNGGGAVTGFKVSVFDSSTDDTTTGFIDRNGNQVAEPLIKIGEGFFFNNASGGTRTWTQILSVNP